MFVDYGCVPCIVLVEGKLDGIRATIEVDPRIIGLGEIDRKNIHYV